MRYLIYTMFGSCLCGSLSKKTSKSGDVAWNDPFVIARYFNNGEQIIYGSLYELIKKIHRLTPHIIECLNENILEDSRGRTSVSENYILREEMLERDVLIFVLYARILNEKIPLLKNKVKLYDNEQNTVGEIDLKNLFNILIHHKYLVLKDGYIRDVFSDKREIGSGKFFGRCVYLPDVVIAVTDLLYDLKVKDICNYLEKRFDGGYYENDRDIIFLAQNLHSLSYTLRRFIATDDGRYNDLIVSIFQNEVSGNINSIDTAKKSVSFEKRGFNLKPADDLDKGKINAHINFGNGGISKDIDYKDMFRMIKDVYGEEQFYKCNKVKFITQEID